MKKIFLMLLVLYSLISCDKKHELETKTGDKWTYLYTDFHQSGYVVAIDTFTFYGYTGQTDCWVNIKNESFESTEPPYGVYKMQETGLYREKCNSNGCNQDLFLKFPGTRDEIYVSYSWGSSPGPYTQEVMQIIAVDTPIHVPMGNIDHVSVYTGKWGGKFRSKVFFHPYFWFIKYESWDANDIGSDVYKNYSYELISYQPG